MELAGTIAGHSGVLNQEAAGPANTGLNPAALSGFEFIVPGECVQWSRAGSGPNSFHYTPHRQRKYGNIVKNCALEAGCTPLEGPIELSVLAVYSWPKSWSAKRRAQPEAVWKTSRPDEDNIKKLIADALNEIAYRDDAQIVSGHCWKKYGDVAHTVVRLRQLG